MQTYKTVCLTPDEPGLVSIAESARRLIRKSCEVDLVTLACHPSTKEAEAGEQQVQGQPGILTKVLLSIDKQYGRSKQWRRSTQPSTSLTVTGSLGLPFFRGQRVYMSPTVN